MKLSIIARAKTLPNVFKENIAIFKKKRKRFLKSVKVRALVIYDKLLIFLQGPVVTTLKSLNRHFLAGKGHLNKFTSKALGPIYGNYVSVRERKRILTNQLEKEGERHKILAEILQHSKLIILYLVVFGLISYFADKLLTTELPLLRNLTIINQNFNLPSPEFIEIGLGIYVGAISAVLGLIVSLIAVGVQQTNERYSEKVSDFINRESVSDYFFSFLVFTDIYSIFVLIKLRMIPDLALISFLLASFFVSLSLLGILIFRTHYINSLKPLSLFRTIWQVCMGEFKIATNQKSYKYKSWSIIIHSRDNTNRHINILADLFRDLIRNEKWSDASYAPIILGYITRDYVEVKKFVDKERGWWFFQQYKEVKADDLTMYPIKANYELEGRGPLHIPSASQSWFEDKVKDLFEEMCSYIPSDKSFKLSKRISDGYKQILVGDYQEVSGDKPKLIPGAIQSQEFDIFESFLKSYLKFALTIDLSNSEISDNFINNYFTISEEMMNKWDIEKVISVAKSFYDGSQLNLDKSFHFDNNLPAYSRDVLINYWNQLEVEQKLEGKIVTPKKFLIAAIKHDLAEKRSETLTAYLTLFFDNSDVLIELFYKQKKYEYVGQFIKMQYEWISRLLYVGELELAEKFSHRIKNNIGYLRYLSKEIVVTLEMLEQAEKGFIVSLRKRLPKVFEVYVDILVMVLVIIRYEETDQNKVTRLMKLPLIWGGVAYLVSEFEQDFHYVSMLTKTLEKSFKPGWMIRTLEIVADMNIVANIFWETTRYSSWYMNELNAIERAVGVKPYSEAGAIGFSEIFDHPSPFIQNLAQWQLMTEERCEEGFVEWLKKREELKKVVLILKQYEQAKSTK